jgi:hypothetical protein
VTAPAPTLPRGNAAHLGDLTPEPRFQDRVGDRADQTTKEEVIATNGLTEERRPDARHHEDRPNPGA